MKLKKVLLNNRKKSFEVFTSRGLFSFPYSKLKRQSTFRDRVVRSFVDDELGREAFTVVYQSGYEETIHGDQLLEYHRDQDYLRDVLLYKLTLQAQKALKLSKVSKREIVRRLHTSPSQFYRLIDPAFYRKTIDQMVRLLASLDCEVDVVCKKAA